MSEIDRRADARVDMGDVPISDSPPVASPSRRRIIRLGASAVPVLATLTSQSALAGQCLSTSAWGSEQISGSASQAARYQKLDVTNGYTISAWNTNDSANAAWTAFTTKYPNFKNHPVGNPQNFKLSELTFAQLYACVGGTYMRNPSSFGFTSSDLVVGHLTSDDKGYFLVAQLNYAVGAKPPTECVTEVNWLAIVAGTYPALGAAWSVHDIRNYLVNNYIVQA